MDNMKTIKSMITVAILIVSLSYFGCDCMDDN